MNEEASKIFILKVLKAFNEKNISVTKILLQKFVYFSMLKNFYNLFRFQPYTYGPFSFDLARQMERLVFWDKIKIDENNQVEVINYDDFEESDEEMSGKIKDDIDAFMDMLDSGLSFSTLELIGTVMYCVDVLKKQEIPITIENVTEEFRGWKGNKYLDHNISEAFEKVKRTLPHLFE